MSPSAYFAMLAVMIVLVACGSDDLTDLEEYARQVKARKPGPIDSLPALEPITGFPFEPEDRRDPFVPDRRSVAIPTAPVGDGIAPDPLRPKEELERFPLDTLTMVGTLARGDLIWALVTTPDRTLFQVSVGNYLGTNHGRIMRITEEKIDLTELVSAGGTWRERRATLALNR